MSGLRQASGMLGEIQRPSMQWHQWLLTFELPRCLLARRSPLPLLPQPWGQRCTCSWHCFQLCVISRTCCAHCALPAANLLPACLCQLRTTSGRSVPSWMASGLHSARHLLSLFSALCWPGQLASSRLSVARLPSTTWHGPIQACFELSLPANRSQICQLWDGLFRYLCHVALRHRHWDAVLVVYCTAVQRAGALLRSACGLCCTCALRQHAAFTLGSACTAVRGSAHSLWMTGTCCFPISWQLCTIRVSLKGHSLGGDAHGDAWHAWEAALIRWGSQHIACVWEDWGRGGARVCLAPATGCAVSWRTIIAGLRSSLKMPCVLWSMDDTEVIHQPLSSSCAAIYVNATFCLWRSCKRLAADLCHLTCLFRAVRSQSCSCCFRADGMLAAVLALLRSWGITLWFRLSVAHAGAASRCVFPLWDLVLHHHAVLLSQGQSCRHTRSLKCCQASNICT